MTRLAPLIDHTLLAPDATPDAIDRLCDEARALGCASVCVNPCHVARAAGRLIDCTVAICTVVGFPLGAATTETKVFETADGLRNGADEIDAVINLGDLKAGLDDLVLRDLSAVVAAASGRIVKAILETSLLSDDEIIRACRLAELAGASFVKTSTGFAAGGATVEAVALMARTVGGRLGIKASGGIRTRETALALVAAGATRIGASKTMDICRDE